MKLIIKNISGKVSSKIVKNLLKIVLIVLKSEEGKNNIMPQENYYKMVQKKDMLPTVGN